MRRHAAFLPLFLVLCSCSVKKYAVNKVGDAIAGTNSSFASDNDPELIRAAVPFSLKLVESLLAQSPRHRGLLLAAASGFTQYAYAFVQEDADEAADTNPARAAALHAEAAKLYLRARDYGLRGLELKHPDFAGRLKANPQQAVKVLKKSEVPFIYWTAVSWAAALSASRNFAMLPEVPRFEALAERAVQLDDTYDEGAIHGFLITYEMSRLNPRPNRFALAKMHFDRNMDLAHGHQAAPLVAYAENVLVAQKDRAAFEAMLKQALALNVDQWPPDRELNLLEQRRARWLLGRENKLFPPAPASRR